MTSEELPHRRYRLVVLSTLQLGSGLVAFLAWSLLSHAVDDNTFSTISVALAWGMAIFMPLTLGTPFLLPNYKRGLTNAQVSPPTLWILRVVAINGVLASSAGLILSIVSVVSRLGHQVLAVALSLAGFACLAAALQVQARLHWRIPWMALATSTGLALPLAWMLAVLVPVHEEWHGSLVSLVLWLAAVATAVVLSRSEIGFWSSTLPSAELARVVRSALPLVPHMFAFSLMLQGSRLAASILNWSPEAVRFANYRMLMLGLGFAVISGGHGMLASMLQRAGDDEVRGRLPVLALGYAALGTVASTGVLVTLTSPLRRLLSGMPAPTTLELVLVVSVPSLLSAYFFLSALLIRQHATHSVAVASMTASALFILLSYLRSDPQENLPIYVLSFAVMTTVAGLRAVRSKGDPRPSRWWLLPLVGVPISTFGAVILG